MSTYKKQLSDALLRQFNGYCVWLAKNPKLSKEVELGLKLSSYLLIHAVDKKGYGETAHQVIYCLSDLIAFLNDVAISRVYPNSNYLHGNNIRTWLTVIEYSEVCLELGAATAWGSRGKWTIVCLIQTFKCLARLRLLLSNNDGLVPYPPIQPLKREAMVVYTPEGNKRAFQLNSGTVVRSIEAGPAFNNDYPNLLREYSHYTFKGTSLAGEILYICKPLIHLWSVKCCGMNSWSQWLTSLAVESLSIKLQWTDYARKTFTADLEWQYLVRIVTLLVYLFRSPLYDVSVKSVILNVLHGFRRVLPFLKFIIDPLIDFLPAWQETYFYLWSH